MGGVLLVGVADLGDGDFLDELVADRRGPDDRAVDADRGDVVASGRGENPDTVTVELTGITVSRSDGGEGALSDFTRPNCET